MSQIRQEGAKTDQIAVRRVKLASAPSPAPLLPAATERLLPTRRRTRFLFGFFLVVAAMAAAWPFLPRRYESLAQVVIRPSELDGRADTASALRQSLDEYALQSDMDLLAVTSTADRIIERHHLMNDPEFRVRGKLQTVLRHLLPESVLGKEPPATLQEVRAAVRAHMIAVRDRKSYTVQIGFWSSDRRKATAIATTLVSAYLDDQIARKRRDVEATSRWLEERVRVISARQSTSEKAVSDFMVTSGLIDRATRQSLDALLTALSTELAVARVKVIETSLKAEALLSREKAGTLDAAPEIVASAAIQRLKERLTDALGRIAVMSNEARVVTDEITVESNRIVRSAEAESQDWRQRESALRDQLSTIRETLIQRQQAEHRLEELQREASNDKAVLNDALTRFKGQSGNAVALRGDVEVIAEPELPGKPAFPKGVLYAVATLLAACLGGLAMNWREFVTPIRRLLAA
jgi:uncharacterized protein involved in exopolysaccharide biosynthesis